jgi:hypothetical protein
MVVEVVVEEGGSAWDAEHAQAGWCVRARDVGRAWGGLLSYCMPSASAAEGGGASSQLEGRGRRGQVHRRRARADGTTSWHADVGMRRARGRAARTRLARAGAQWPSVCALGGDLDVRSRAVNLYVVSLADVLAGRMNIWMRFHISYYMIRNPRRRRRGPRTGTAEVIWRCTCNTSSHLPYCRLIIDLLLLAGRARRSECYQRTYCTCLQYRLSRFQCHFNNGCNTSNKASSLQYGHAELSLPLALSFPAISLRHPVHTVCLALHGNAAHMAVSAMTSKQIGHSSSGRSQAFRRASSSFTRARSTAIRSS